MQVTDCEPLPLKVAFVPDVDEVAHFHSRHAHVVKHWASYSGSSSVTALSSSDDAAQDEQVGFVAGRKLVVFVIDFQFLLGQERGSGDTMCAV